MIENGVEKLVELFLKADRSFANDLIDKWIADRGTGKVLTDLLEPALLEFGELWASRTDISLAQGYIAAKIAADTLRKISDSGEYSTEVTEPRGRVVIGNIEDDYHMLGRKLVGTMLSAAGWKVYDLGNDVLAEEFVDKAQEVGANIVGASAMMYSTASNISKLREEIDSRGLTGQLQLAVGGAVFLHRPELVEEIGGDGTARNAIEAIDLMEVLSEASKEASGEK